jgi:hypothetical protein
MLAFGTLTVHVAFRSWLRPDSVVLTQGPGRTDDAFGVLFDGENVVLEAIIVDGDGKDSVPVDWTDLRMLGGMDSSAWVGYEGCGDINEAGTSV